MKMKKKENTIFIQSVLVLCAFVPWKFTLQVDLTPHFITKPSQTTKKSKRKIKEKKLRMKEIYTVHIDVNTTEAFMIHIFEKISLEYI